MAGEFVEPVRYAVEPVAQVEEVQYQNMGFRRWLVVAALFVVSYYMYSIEAVAYSTVFFMAGTILMIGLTIHLKVTQPNQNNEATMKRKDLLDRWSK